jgi:hypothetical protein
MGLQVYSRVEKKLLYLHTSSFTHTHARTRTLTPTPTREPSPKKKVFWDCEDLLCGFLVPKTTINSDKYCETLEELCTAIKWKRLGGLTTGARPLHHRA